MLSRCARQIARGQYARHLVYRKSLHWTPACWNVAQKYLEKVQKRAKEKGISVDELKQKVKEPTRPRPLPEARELKEKVNKLETSKKTDGPLSKVTGQSERKDTLPVKPLSEIMDIHKILRTPHSAQQISALWTVFHASRSGGTGRGYLSASFPIQTYEKLVQEGKKYPTFILPLLRHASQMESSESRDDKAAYEFFFMQWSFHAALPIPVSNILDTPVPENTIPPAPTVPISTVLFAPLLEYKTRTTFATPHLVLTMYPDLAQTHRLVLLRGELTPSPAGIGRYLLSQQDAQLLALGLQKFYLAHGDEKQEDAGKKERAELLRVFNEKPEEFCWEDLLKHANPTL